MILPKRPWRTDKEKTVSRLQFYYFRPQMENNSHEHNFCNRSAVLANRMPRITMAIDLNAKITKQVADIY
jgi:hypothetical protein